MANYKLKIAGKEYDQVQGSEDWAKSVLRDLSDRVFRMKGDFQMKGWGDLFSLIYANTLSNGVCQSLEGRVYFRESKVDAYSEWWRGEIKMQDSEFDLIKNSVDTQVLDDVWASTFKQADKQKVFIATARSKNGDQIAPCPSSLCEFFSPQTGAYIFLDRQCYNVYDVFEFLVNYYTDGDASFASDFFSTGQGKDIWITLGSELTTGDNDCNPEVSFADLFDEMNKKFCLWIVIETDDKDNPVLRIEEQGYAFEETMALEVENPESIKLNIALDQLYTTIEVGSDSTRFDNSIQANFPNVQFRSWNNESYNTSGDCQFENNSLNLVSQWKIDNNSFESLFIGLNDDFEDDIFIVEIDSTTLQAKQTDTGYVLPYVPYTYNDNLKNDQVIANWFDGIPQAITKELGVDYYFYADNPTNGTLATGFSPDAILYDNDSASPAEDTENIYTTPTENPTYEGQFEAPTSAIYTFTASVNVTVPGPVGGGGAVRLSIYYYTDNTLGTSLAESVYLDGYQFSDGETNTLEGSDQFFLQKGEVAMIRCETQVTTNVNSGHFTMLPLGGIDYAETTTQPLIYEYNIQRFKLSLADFNTLDNNLGYIRFLDTKNNLSYSVWPTDLKYNPVSQIVEVGKFIGRPPLEEQCVWLLLEGTWNDADCWIDDQLWIDPPFEWFIMTVKTDNAGVSNNDQFQIPTTGGGYDYIVNWGDGEITSGNTGTVTHTYAASGTYTVKVAGDFPRIYFAFGGDKLKLLTIEQWGNIEWTSMLSSFFGCTNLDVNATDSPDLSGVTSLQGMFASCSSLVYNSSIDNWDVSTITSMLSMFQSCTVFNQSINSWDVKAVTDMGAMFANAPAFNQPFDNWLTLSLTNLNSMFNNNTPIGTFNQDIGNWDISNVTDTNNVLNNQPNLSTANYDALLTGWTGWSGGVATRSVPSSLNLNGSFTYSLGSDAADARAWLIATKLWIITDGGGV